MFKYLKLVRQIIDDWINLLTPVPFHDKKDHKIEEK